MIIFSFFLSVKVEKTKTITAKGNIFIVNQIISIPLLTVSFLKNITQFYKKWI